MNILTTTVPWHTTAAIIVALFLVAFAIYMDCKVSRLKKEKTGLEETITAKDAEIKVLNSKLHEKNTKQAYLKKLLKEDYK